MRHRAWRQHLSDAERDGSVNLWDLVAEGDGNDRTRTTGKWRHVWGQAFPADCWELDNDGEDAERGWLGWQ